jgi:hypothetical protein
MNSQLPAVAPFPKERSLDHPFFVPLTFNQTPYAGDRVLYRQVSYSWYYLLTGMVISHMTGSGPGQRSDTEIKVQIIHVPAGSRTLYYIELDADNVGGPGPSDGFKTIGAVNYPLARERGKYVPHSNIFAPGDVWGVRISYPDLAPGNVTPLVRILALGRHCMNTQGGNHVR